MADVVTIDTKVADAILATYGTTDSALESRCTLASDISHSLATETKDGKTRPASGAAVYAAILASATIADADRNVDGFGRASIENALTADAIARESFADKRADKSRETVARVLRLVNAGRAEATRRYIHEMTSECKTASQRASAFLSIDLISARARVKEIQVSVKALNASKRVTVATPTPDTTGASESTPTSDATPTPAAVATPATVVAAGKVPAMPTATATPGESLLSLIREARALVDGVGDTIPFSVLADAASEIAALSSVVDDLAAMSADIERVFGSRA